MNTNQLSNESRKVLMAILQDGAKERQIHSSHIGNIMRLLGWKSSQESDEKIRAIFYEIDQNGNLKITVNITEKLAYHL